MNGAARAPAGTQEPLVRAGGFLYSSAAARRLLEGAGLACEEALFGAGEPVRAGRHAHKEVARVALGATAAVYIKRQWRGPRRWTAARAFLRGRLPVSDPVREWRGLSAAGALGLSVAEPLALWCPPGVWPLGAEMGRTFRQRAAVVVRAVPPTRSLHDLLCGGALRRLDAPAREQLSRAIAGVAARLEAAGLFWRSFAPQHVFPEIAADEGSGADGDDAAGGAGAPRTGGERLYLIDLEGLCRNRRAPAWREQRRKFADLAAAAAADWGPVLRAALCGSA